MIVVDDVIYNVDVIDVDLDTEFQYKYAERTEDMSLNYELGGVFFNQSLVFGTDSNKSDMAKLWDVLSSKSTIDKGTGHNVQIWTPLGKMTFLMYPNKVNIKLLREKGSMTWWTGMSVKFIGVKPARS
jgi:hypothetical protein